MQFRLRLINLGAIIEKCFRYSLSHCNFSSRYSSEEMTHIANDVKQNGEKLNEIIRDVETSSSWVLQLLWLNNYPLFLLGLGPSP